MNDNIKEKYGFSLIIIIITLFFFRNCVAGVEGNIMSLIVGTYSLGLIVFIAWILSIIIAIKEKNKIRIITCIMITILAIIYIILCYTMMYPDTYTHIIIQIELAIFLYEIIDFFRIKIEINILNIITLIICSILIFMFLISQTLTINKYTNSLKKFSYFTKSNNLTYEKIATEFDSLVVDHFTYDEIYGDYFENIYNHKLFITPAYDYKVQYSAVVNLIENSIEDTGTTKKQKDKLTQWLVETGQVLLHESRIADTVDNYNKVLLKAMIIFMFEIIMVCFLALKNRP